MADISENTLKKPQNHVKRTMIDPMEFFYSEVYSDDKYDYRHVIPPTRYREKLPVGRLLSEDEWREIGIRMSIGWEHYMIHSPEKFIFCFRRPRKVTTTEN
uniref:Cyclin-dependent kinases regulatory subunit n=1 Tax=Panagrolaimus sp. JU765 TaxID=591449 RepID=A0AC34RAB1_9BILA